MTKIFQTGLNRTGRNLFFSYWVIKHHCQKKIFLKRITNWNCSMYTGNRKPVPGRISLQGRCVIIINCSIPKERTLTRIDEINFYKDKKRKILLSLSICKSNGKSDILYLQKCSLSRVRLVFRVWTVLCSQMFCICNKHQVFWLILHWFVGDSKKNGKKS